MFSEITTSFDGGFTAHPELVQNRTRTRPRWEIMNMFKRQEKVMHGLTKSSDLSIGRIQVTGRSK
ncbi:hypothetical protein E2C01_012908 [Portunus trituberculatus]|uniref:Uncharacterized protein n=1 Tax=Portunus trituberculatus TaxID=210409 RepID=A0A5B7DF95_PORTR|nr:hypothetical protein [Portunus trituberculatus]